MTVRDRLLEARQAGKVTGPAVVLVDPVQGGAPFKQACAELGLPVIGVYTIESECLARLAPQHHGGDRLTAYGGDPDILGRFIEDRVEAVSAVVPTTEPAVEIAALLAQRWGLAGNPTASARARRDKREMRRLAAARGLRVPRFEVAGDTAAVARSTRRIGLPVIVKPATGAGSHNVSLLACPTDLAKVASAGRRDIFGGAIQEWLVEEYVRGREFAVNTFSGLGQHVVLDVWEYRMPDAADYDNPYWDFVQVDPDDAEVDRVATFTQEVLEAFEIRLGPCHIEIKLAATGPVLIEIGARLPGAGIPLMWQRHSAFRPYAETLAVHLGQQSDALAHPPRFDARLGMCFIRHDGPPGRLRRLHGLEEVRRLPGVDEVITPAVPGDLVETTRSLGSELAKVRLCAPTDAALTGLIDRVRATLTAEIEPIDETPASDVPILAGA